MPTTFMAIFTTDKVAFNNLYQQFLDSEVTVRQGTEAKIKTNKAVHQTLKNMLLDRQEILKTNDAVRKQFVYTDLLYLVKCAGVASLKGTVIDQATSSNRER